MTLGAKDLPAFFQSADATSLSAQKQALRRTGTGLMMVVIAAGAGAFSWRVESLGIADLAGVIAAAAFAVALLMRLYMFTDRPDKTWYDGRAAAESAKSLAWCYSVGGKPFEIGKDPDKVDALFLTHLKELMSDLGEVSLALSPPDSRTQITEGMRRLRTMPPEDRKEAYRIGRVGDQQGWYSRKARLHKIRADRWNVALMSAEGLGLAGGIAKAAGLVSVDTLGLFGAVVAAGTAWMQTKQHTNLARAYSIVAHELSALSDRIPAQKNEEAWTRFVKEAEDTISREHKLWRASRTTR